MSIKQNGGVFGRNPTFNDVTIEGQLTFDGDIDINSDLSVDGDLDVTGFVTSEGLIHNGDSNTYVKFLPDRIYMDVGGQRRIDLEVNSTKVVNNGVVKLQTGSTLTDGLVIDANQDVSIPNGNIEMGNGYGIDFSATGTGTSELFSDYEEGSWTPAFTGNDSGTSTQTVNAATYTKIGRAVHITCYLSAVDVSSVLGASMNLTGLPFTCSSFQHFTAGYSSLFTFDQADIGVSGYTTNGSTSCRLLKGSSTTSISATAEATTTSGIIMITFTYQTDA